jgi:hypothetical protein
MRFPGEMGVLGHFVFLELRQIAHEGFVVGWSGNKGLRIDMFK